VIPYESLDVKINDSERIFRHQQLVESLSGNTQNAINEIENFLEQKEGISVTPVLGTPFIFVQYAPSTVSRDDFYISHTYWDNFTALEHLRDHSYSMESSMYVSTLFLAA